jgi:hypothetical protein
MNKSIIKKKKKGAASKGLAAAYVMYEGSQPRGSRIDSGVDVIAGTVYGSVAFEATGYNINPGLELRFPSLSQEAKRYDCYEFLELTFRFIGTTVISTTVGQIGLAFDPNPHTQAPSTQARFSAYEAHVASSVYKPDGLTLKVPKHMLTGRRYVRRGIEGNSLFAYDPGMLVIMTRDESSTNAIGYVEASYKIRFSDFHLEPTTSPVSHRILQITKVANQNLVSTVAGDWALDTCVTIDGMEHSLTAGALTLYTGVYRLSFVMMMTDNAAEDFKGRIVVNVDGVSVYDQTANMAATATTEALQVIGDVFVSLDDTSVVTLSVTLTGAAGVLTINNTSKLLVEAL